MKPPCLEADIKLDLPRSPWDMPPEMLRENGTMICVLWLASRRGFVTDVQWGPFGFQKTPAPHQDPFSGRDCRACRYTMKQLLAARLMGKTMDLDIMGRFTIRMTESGEVRMAIGRA